MSQMTAKRAIKGNGDSHKQRFSRRTAAITDRGFVKGELARVALPQSVSSGSGKMGALAGCWIHRFPSGRLLKGISRLAFLRHRNTFCELVTEQNSHALLRVGTGTTTRFYYGMTSATQTSRTMRGMVHAMVATVATRHIRESEAANGWGFGRK